MNNQQKNFDAVRVDTLVIGGGQAGLAMGYYLARANADFVILDAHDRVGDAWRQRWDSLRLFTPAKFDGLPGLPFPGNRLAFPTKGEQADYLEAYAAHVNLPVQTGVRVDRLRREGDRYIVSAGERRWEAKNVVVATGGCDAPRVPAFASELSSQIHQVHSSAYRNPEQLPEGPVLVVGVGNSGAEIALEVSRTHPTTIAGEPSGEFPFRHGPTAARFILPLLRFAALHVLTLNTPVGRKALPKVSAHGLPLIRTKRDDLTAAGVASAPRVTGVAEGKPVVGDTAMDAASVIWCTGFRTRFDWIQLPEFDADGMPQQHRGVVESAPGLYFLGQEFMFRAASGTLPGVPHDARYLLNCIMARSSSGERGARSALPSKRDRQPQP